MRSSVTAVKDLDTRLRFDVRDDEAQAIFVCNPKVAQLEESVAVANARRRSNRTIPGSEFLSRYVVGADVAIISEDLDGVAIAVPLRTEPCAWTASLLNATIGFSRNLGAHGLKQERCYTYRHLSVKPKLCDMRLTSTLFFQRKLMHLVRTCCKHL